MLADATQRQGVHTLYSEHHSWLVGWLRQRLGCPADAADLSHDAFIRVFAADAVAEIREPRAYLTTVAKNLLLNLYRRRALEQAYLDALAALPEPLAPSPEDQALILEAVNDIDALLQGLPPKVREAFLLAQMEGLAYADIARRLNVSERSVKRYVAQALAQCILLAE